MLAAWIAEHMVDLCLRRTQMRGVVSQDPLYYTTQIAQLTALRDQAKEYWLRTLHARQSHDAGALPDDISPYSSLPFVVQKIKSLLNS